MSRIDSENSKEHSKETISALLDNEADDLELRRFLKSCEQDPSLLEIWERYSLVQSILHDPAQPVNASLSQRIADQIEQEAPLSSSTPSTSATPLWSVWKEGLSKMAIAASVAAVFLFTVQLSLDSSIDSSVAPAIAGQAVENTPATSAESLAVRTVLAESELLESDADASAVVDGGMLVQYIESLTLDDEEPVRIEHMQDSPLYHLVNRVQEKP